MGRRRWGRRRSSPVEPQRHPGKPSAYPGISAFAHPGYEKTWSYADPALLPRQFAALYTAILSQSLCDCVGRARVRS